MPLTCRPCIGPPAALPAFWLPRLGVRRAAGLTVAASAPGGGGGSGGGARPGPPPPPSSKRASAAAPVDGAGTLPRVVLKGGKSKLFTGALLDYHH